MSSERFFHNKRVRRRVSTKLKVSLVFVTVLLFILFVYNFRVLPIISNIAISNAETVLQTTVAGEVSAFLAEHGDDYVNLIEYQYDKDGNMISYSVNQKNANLLINDVTKVISTSASVDEMEVSVPLGSIFDDVFLNSAGPQLTFNMIMTTSSFITFKSEFESQGINQTRHKIIMEVNMPVELLIPGKKIESRIDTAFIVSDTVIVGKVPDICLRSVDLAV